ncbi:MAG: hypothetical protein R3362_09720 [Rhodothermales bacterium]|nr:hypothetical protein [Rhodothermales bacterium]
MSFPPTSKKRRPFDPYDFDPQPWERKRMHRYAAGNAPLWWRVWVRLRRLGATLGVG